MRLRIAATAVAVLAATFGIAAPAQATTTSSGNLVFGQFTHSGLGDIIKKTGDGKLLIYYNQGNPQKPYVGTGVQIGTGWNIYSTIAAGNIDNPSDDATAGVADLLGIKPDGTLWVYYNTGDPDAPFVGSGTQIGTAWGIARLLTTGDVNRDGYDDIIMASTDGWLTIYYNTKNRQRPFELGGRIGPGWNAISAIAGGDVNHDGYADIVATKPDGTVSVYYNTTRNVPYTGSGTQFGSGWNGITRWGLTNVTGSTDTDLLATRTDGNLLLFPYTGDNGRPYNNGTPIGSGW